MFIMSSIIPLLLFVLLGVWHTVIASSCSIQVDAPCTCASSKYEPIGIVCENAGSLAQVLSALRNPSVIIDSLVIANTPINELPGYAFSGLAIKRLVLRNNGMVSIHPDAFDQPITQTLMELEIRHNQLGEVPQSGLPRLQALRTLVLAKNGIRTVPNSAFFNYASKNLLKRLDLSANRLQEIPPGAFIGVENLVELSLDKNFLESVPTTALARLRNLEDLSLAVNRIKQVPVGTLPFQKLKSLSLEVNSIDYIPRQSFESIPNLLYLYLGSNQFNIVDPQVFYYVPKLKVLAMSNNPKIDRISANAFEYIPELVRLEMSECSLTVIDTGAFQRIKKAQVIVMNRNQLKRITSGMFEGLTELVSLDLKTNLINEVDDRSFSGLPSLKHLDLGDNNLATLKSLTFWRTFEKTTPATTRVLYLYDNEWHCDTTLTWLRNWLRANPDIIIDAPGHEPSRCAQPQTMASVGLRTDVQPQPISTTEASQQLISTDTPPPEPFFGQNQPSNVKMSGVDVIAIVLGIILGMFCLSLILLMIVRYFISKSRRDRKFDDERRLAASSTISGGGYHTGGTSSLGGGGLAYISGSTNETGNTSTLYRQQHYGYAPQHLPPGVQEPNGQRAYFLNRPWYWWF